MASAKINGLCNCKICFNAFGDQERCPRILACGHTYCHVCLQRFISDKSDCPTCHKEINFNSANDILINFLAKSLSETVNVSNNKTHEVIEANVTMNQITMNEKKVPLKEELPYNGHCEKHHLPNHFKCLKCKEYICGTCATLMHKSCTQVFPVLEAMNLMKSEKLKKLNVSRCKLTKGIIILINDFEELKEKHKDLKKEIKETKKEMHLKYKLILKNNNTREELNSLEKSLDAAKINEEYEKTDAKLEFLFKDTLQFPCILSKEESVYLLKEDLKNCNLFVMKKDEKDRPEYMKVELMEDKLLLRQWKSDLDDDKCIILVELSDFIASRDVVCNTKVFFENHKDVIQNPIVAMFGQSKYSAIELSDDGTIRLECFRNKTEDEIPIDFETFLKAFGCSTVIPTKAFLEIKNVTLESRGEVIISAYDINPISLNFLLYASGLCFSSYKLKRFGCCDEAIMGGGYKTKTNCELASVDGIKETKLRGRTVVRGSVEGGFLDSTSTNYLNEFRVHKKRAKTSSSNIFGEIFLGLDVIENIKDGDIIMECGFFIDCKPK